MDKNLKTFWLKLMVFLAPFAVGFAALTGMMIYLGESLPLELVVNHQRQNDRVIYRYRYGNRDQQFKTLSVNMRQPEVLALGSSRILQFRAGFFNRNPDIFYNAAGPAWRLPQVSRLLYSLNDDALPRILLLSIDPTWFNEHLEDYDFPEDISDIGNIFLVNRSFLQDVIRGVNFGRSGFDVSAYFARRDPGGSGGLALGLRAIRDGHGFRSDGSEQYGDFLVAGWLRQETQRMNHLNWMREGLEMYTYGDSLHEDAVAQFAELLAFAAEHNIYVIGFLPPYAPALWEEMMERGNHPYIPALTPRLEALFEQYNFPFFDFSNGARVGIRDEEFFDGWHASELGNLRMYLYMLRALPDVLGAYSDYETLLHTAQTATNTWDVFGMGRSDVTR